MSPNAMCLNVETEYFEITSPHLITAWPTETQSGRRHYSLCLFSRQPSCVQHLATNVKPFFYFFCNSIHESLHRLACTVTSSYLSPVHRSTWGGVTFMWASRISKSFRAATSGPEWERRKWVVQLSGISMIHSLPGTERSCPLCTGSGTNNHWGKKIKVVFKDQ